MGSNRAPAMNLRPEHLPSDRSISLVTRARHQLLLMGPCGDGRVAGVADGVGSGIGIVKVRRERLLSAGRSCRVWAAN